MKSHVYSMLPKGNNNNNIKQPTQTATKQVVTCTMAQKKPLI